MWIPSLHLVHISLYSDWMETFSRHEDFRDLQRFTGNRGIYKIYGNFQIIRSVYTQDSHHIWMKIRIPYYTFRKKKKKKKNGKLVGNVATMGVLSITYENVCKISYSYHDNNHSSKLLIYLQWIYIYFSGPWMLRTYISECFNT